MALQITGLSKTYPNGVRALKDLSLTVGNNMFGLLGPNGAGKSSLMRTIATLQDPDAGSISLDGLNVLTQKNEVRKILGYLPQEFGVYPKMSAVDMLHHLAVLKGVTAKGERSDEEMPLYMRRERMTRDHQTFNLVVDERPTRAGIDPYNKLIDRVADDNMIDVSEQ